MFVPLKVATEVLPGISGIGGAGAKVNVVPVGSTLLAVNAIGVTKPPVLVVAILTAADVAPQPKVVGVDGTKLNSANGATTLKLVLEISKKILPTASILIRAVVLKPTGIVTACVPSFGVVASNTVGKVKPPSVEKEIFTLAQLIGAALVLFTSQVIV